MNAATQPPAPRAHAELDDLTLARARAGEHRALRALIERYERPVFALLGRMLGPDGVEDAAQETFLRVCRALPRFDPGPRASLSTWILTIATRLAIDELRRRKRPLLLVSTLPPVVDPHADPERRVAGREAGAALGRAIDALSPEQRAAFVLRVFHHRSYAEIAAALSISLGTVKSRIARARAALYEALEDAP